MAAQPLIPVSVLDAPTQRVYAVSCFAAVQVSCPDHVLESSEVSILRLASALLPTPGLQALRRLSRAGDGRRATYCDPLQSSPDRLRCPLCPCTFANTASDAKPIKMVAQLHSSLCARLPFTRAMERSVGGDKRTLARRSDRYLLIRFV